MIGITSRALGFKPCFGALKGGTTGLNNYERIDLVKDTLMCDWIRTRIVVFNAPPEEIGGANGWTGSSNVYDYAKGRGLKQVVVIVAYPTGGVQPFVSSSSIPAYKAVVQTIMDAYPEIDCVVVDNEAENNNYHVITNIDSILDYINMMQAVVEVCKPMGIKVADSGLLDNFAIRIRTYQWVITKYGQGEADAFALNSRMTKHQVDYANGIDTDDIYDVGCANHDRILAFQGLTYTNMHFYEDPILDSAVDIATNVFRYQKEYVEAVGKRRTMSNEVGQRNNSQPDLVTNAMTNFYQLGLEYCIWWDGSGNAGARPLTSDSTGERYPNGDAFVAKVISYK